MIMYDNNMTMNLKQKKTKFEPRIKLNHNTYIENSLSDGIVHLINDSISIWFLEFSRWLISEHGQ